LTGRDSEYRLRHEDFDVVAAHHRRSGNGLTMSSHLHMAMYFTILDRTTPPHMVTDQLGNRKSRSRPHLHTRGR
jgi:hypothetical protein